MIWLVLGLCAASAVAILLWPLLRVREAAPDRALYDVALYRAQLAEIERDRARGALDEKAHAAALLEVQRRLLAASAGADDAAAPRAEGQGVAGRWVLLLAGLLVPVLALAIYLPAGSPDLPAMPLAERRAAEARAQNEPETLLAALRARLAQLPPDSAQALEGWLLLGAAERRRNRFAQAAEAFARAHAIRPDPDIGTDWAEMLIADADGRVPEQARALLRAAQAARASGPGSERARFYLGLAAMQAGDPAAALGFWRPLLQEAPAEAPWLALLRQRIAEAEAALAGAGAAGSARPAPPASGPSPEQMAAASAMPPEQRAAMIGAMVEGLAARLRETPDDAEGWQRLARARLVLREGRAAREAAMRARALRPAEIEPYALEAEALAQIAAGSAPPSELLGLMRAALALPGAEDDRRLLWYGALAEAEHGERARARTLFTALLARTDANSPLHAEARRRLEALAP